MSDGKVQESEDCLDLEYELDAPPEKVWRALSLSELLRRWLPDTSIADSEAASVIPGEEVRYRLRDASPPFLESIVTFRIAPNDTGGTTLRIVHKLTDARIARLTNAAANSDGAPLMRAA